MRWIPLIPCLFLAAWTLPAQDLQLARLGTFSTGIIGAGGAEIVAHDPGTQRAYIVNAAGPNVQAIDISNPASPRLLFTIAIPIGYAPDSVAVKNGIVAVAIEAPVRTDRGLVAFYDVDGNIINAVTVGSLPDMLTFTPDGSKVLVANEGEPSADYSIDPEGTVSIINLARGVRNIGPSDVTEIRFNQLRREDLPPSVRIFGPRASVAQDIEPEFIAVSPDSKTAFVTLQENNAVAVIDVDAARITRIIGLGFKDHRLPGNRLDPSDRDNAIRLGNWPVLGMYLPDSIAAYATSEGLFFLTANEGDARDYPGAFQEERRVAELTLDSTAFPDGDTLKQNANLGRLRVTNTLGDTDGDGDFDRLYSYGARSFTVWNAATGALVWDSGDQLETIQAANRPELFNVSNNNNLVDDRSDDKGPEPEGIAVGRIGERAYAFIGCERDGTIYMYDVTDPRNPRFVARADNRIHTGDPAQGTAGDLGPEGITFVPAAESPTRRPLVLVANEISGTMTIWEVR